MPSSRGTRSRASSSTSTSVPFSDDCKQVLQRLRGALSDVVSGLGMDPTRPQELARSLGLHRTLAWKICRIINATDVFATVPQVPGRSGLEIVARAMRKAGAREEEVSRIRSASEDFDRLVTLHAGDRGTLQVFAGALAPGAPQREAMLQARRLAFRGISAIWGVQARVLLSTNILAPNAADPSRVDVAQVYGWVEFRGLRSDVTWPLFRRAWWGEGRPARAVDGEPLLPTRLSSDVPLLDEFCSPDMPPLDVVHSEKETTYWLPARKVGRTGGLTCIYASVIRNAGSQHAVGRDRRCTLHSNLVTPVELLHSDLLVHESMTWAHAPRADVYSLLEQRASTEPGSGGLMRLPIHEQVHELGLGLPTMAAPHLPRYRDLLESVFGALGWDASQFRGFRTLIPFPPVPSRMTVSMELLPEVTPGA